MRKRIQQVITSAPTSNFTIPASFPSSVGVGLVVEVGGVVVPHYMTSATALTLRVPTLANQIVNFYEADAPYLPVNSAQAALDFPSIGANATASLTVTVQGAALGATVDLGLPSNIAAGVIYQAYVSAANVVTVQAFNVTAGAIDPPSGVFKVTVA